MKRRYYFIIIFLILAVNMVIVIFANNKFMHITQEIVDQSAYYSMTADYNEFPAYTEFPDIKSLENESDLVLKIKLNGQKQYVQEDTLATATVIESLKGESTSEIKIAEPFNINNYNTEANVYGGYVPLNTNQEYIVFLKKTKLEEVYKYTSIEFGHFVLNKKESNILDYSNESTKSIGEIIKYDFLYIYGDTANQLEMIDTRNSEELISIDMSQLKEQYKKLKRECFNKYTK